MDTGRIILAMENEEIKEKSVQCHFNHLKFHEFHRD
jgi:hypothetical protein